GYSGDACRGTRRPCRAAIVPGVDAVRSRHVHAEAARRRVAATRVAWLDRVRGARYRRVEPAPIEHTARPVVDLGAIGDRLRIVGETGRTRIAGIAGAAGSNA